MGSTWEIEIEWAGEKQWMSKDASETNKRMGLKEFEYKKNKDSP